MTRKRLPWWRSIRRLRIVTGRTGLLCGTGGSTLINRSPKGILMKISSPTPQQLGYYFPAEFDKHTATWLSWRHKEASCPGKIKAICPSYSLFVKELALGNQASNNLT